MVFTMNLFLGEMGNGWGYTYNAYKIRGFKQTHQPSPWINDYAAFSLFPETGKLEINEDKRASWFSHKAEISKPHYYKVYLADYDVTTEIVPTERGAQFQFTFPKTDNAHVLVDGFFKGSMVKVFPEERKIVGYCRNNSACSKLIKEDATFAVIFSLFNVLKVNTAPA